MTFDSTTASRRAVVGGLAAMIASRWPLVAAQAGPNLVKPPARGVNLSHWFAQSTSGYGSQHLRTYINDNDFSAIASAGFSHVRIGIEPAILFSDSGQAHLDERVIEDLVAGLRRAAAKKLAIVLDIHPGNSAAKSQLREPEKAARFVDNWRLLAARLAEFSPDTLFLEIQNEPEALDGLAWWTLQGAALDAIRSADRRRIVVASAGGWSSIEGLVEREPYNDDKVVYNVHYYAPLLFTHQSTDWAWDVAERVSGLGWPVAAEDAAAVTGQAAKRDDDKQILRNEISQGHFTRAAMMRDFDRLSAWSSKHRVPVYVGEFGVYAKSAPLEARERWIGACRQAFEERGWGWALWDYSASFGLLRVANKTFDPNMLKILGVRS